MRYNKSVAKPPPKKPLRPPDTLEEGSQAFQIKPQDGNSDVPDVSRLLNRKKLKSAPQPPIENTLTSGTATATDTSVSSKQELTMDSFVFDSSVFLEETSAESKPAPPPPEAVELKGVDQQNEISFNLETFAEAQSAQSVVSVETKGSSQVVPGRRARSIMQPLVIWDKSALRKSKDSIAQLLMAIPENELVAAVFLGARQENRSLVFLATAAYSPGDRIEVWTGLVWDPRIVADLWSQFAQKGNIELSPPSVNTLITSNRNVTRATFGVEPEEFLTLFQIGPKNQFRGLLAVITHGSLEAKIPSLQKIASESA